MATTLEAAVRATIDPVVTAAGLQLEKVAIAPAGRRSVLRVTVDLPEDATGAVDLDTVAAASRAISAALDADDVVPGAYVLEVSSPGTDRPLTETRHFRRARGRLVHLGLTDGPPVTGRLREAGDDVVVLVTSDGAERTVQRAAIRSARVEAELTREEETGHGD